MPSIFVDDPEEQPTGAAAAPQQVTPDGDSRPSSSSENRSPRDDDRAEAGIRMPPRLRQQFGGGLRTAGDAFLVCKALFEEQVERAGAERPHPNQPITGDSSARSAFLLLLTDSQQRELFIEFSSKPSAWPRIKPLVGAPPYHFLMPQDAGVLNAGGFARNRINMTYDHVGKIANLNQFGPGQLVDEHTREYRVAPRTLQESDPLPGADYFNRATKDLVLQVKVKRQGIAKKRELFHSEFKKQLLFPQPGEAITLSETQRMLTATGLRVPSRTTLRVKALWPRGQGASTAAVLVGF
jgi:hypothetical protein